jgi:transposase
VEQAEAEAILEGDREAAIGLLLRLDDLVAANERLVEANERLEARVAELERRLSRSSRNSSLPPSQDPPSAPPRPRGKGSGRKQGGQPGHEGRYRRLLALELVDEIVEHWPDRCQSCKREFSESELVDAEEPSRHQLAELPPIAVKVSEHRLHWVCCPACAAITTALPAESRSAFGPRLQAAIVTLAVRNRISRRQTSELARELFGVELATGTVDAIVQRAGEALAAPHTRLEQEIKQSAVVNIDETGWKTKGERRTLWAALTAQTALFRIASGRHACEAQLMLGERYGGIVCSDRYAGYDYLDPTRRQLCWAHLLRDFTAHSEGMGEQAQFGATGLVVANELFKAWQQFQHDGNQAKLRRRITPLQANLRQQLEHASRKSARTKYHRQFARNLLKRWPALWTFTHTDGVEPTNNHAERGLRGAVIYRKLSLGTQSERGERSLERLLSASITCRLRDQSLFAYLTQVITAHVRGDPIPSLS